MAKQMENIEGAGKRGEWEGPKRQSRGLMISYMSAHDKIQLTTLDSNNPDQRPERQKEQKAYGRGMITNTTMDG